MPVAVSQVIGGTDGWVGLSNPNTSLDFFRWEGFKGNAACCIQIVGSVNPLTSIGWKL
jgi:hypothetical protein